MASIALKPFGSDKPEAGYVGWSPAPLNLEGINPSGDRKVVLKSSSKADSVARVVFLTTAGAVPVDEITVELNERNQQTVLIAGKFQPGKLHNGASADSKDVVIEAAWADNPGSVEGSVDIMIRVRKDANTLNEKARNDFLDALAFLNGIGDFPAAGAGKGIYVTDFVGMHVAGAYDIGHGDSHFLPWHRLYLLDLERLLQKVNPAVTLPYWRFDKPASNVFSEYFMGKTEQIPNDTVFTQGWSDKFAKFAGTNPLSDWKIGEVKGILRAAYFNTEKEPALGRPDAATPDDPDDAFKLIDEIATLLLGGYADPEMGTRRRGSRRGFSEMEGTPHGAAHTSFNGPVNAVPDAPRDPLFFLLHCNVDRLWALWQFIFDRYGVRESSSYPYQKKLEISAHSDGLISGMFPELWKVADTRQWPWDTGQSKPGHLQPPGTRGDNFTTSAAGGKVLDSPSSPNLADAIDAFAFEDLGNYLGFSYDDVPFPHERKVDQFADLSTAGSDNQIVVSSEYRKHYQEKLLDANRSNSAMQGRTERLLEIARDPREIDRLVHIINDPQSPVDDIVSAIDTFNIVSNFSPIIRSRMANIVNALRGMMTSPEEQLRIRALSILTMMKDEVAQEFLLKELTSDANEAQRRVPTPMAISMLGRDEKALPASLLTKIAANPPNLASLVEAVRHMSANEESLPVLRDILADDSKPLEVRAMIPEMINRFDPAAFLDVAMSKLSSEGAEKDDLTPFLTRGLAGISDPDAAAKLDDAKKRIRELQSMASASAFLKNLASKFLSEDDDSATR